MPAPKLQNVHRTFIVRETAAYATPTEVKDMLFEAFGIELSLNSIQHYDPTVSFGRKLATKWTALFEECRKAFIDDVTGSIPLAHKSVRIRKLSNAAISMEKRGNLLGMADMLERIAKELGNVHTNRREHTGKGGGPIRYAEIADMTDEQVEAELQELAVDLGYTPAPLLALPAPDDTKH